MMAPRWSIGFTATPFRSAEHESLSLWDSLIYRYGLGDALRDGVLVPWRVVNWDGQGDADTDLVCIDLIKQHGHGPGIVSARSIDDATDYARVLTDSGIPALEIHSRMDKTEQDRRLAALLAGDLRCLVHVALLTEGVDIPPLRWLCMRRPVTARVRFVQELGRVLRVSPGKTEAVVMDPHDLFGAHGIMHEPAIGESGEDESGLEQITEPRIGEGVELGEDVVMPPAKAVDLTTQWARRVLIEMQLSGLAGSDAVSAGSWRTRRPTDSQVATVQRMSKAFARFLPESIREAVKSLARADVVRAGQVVQRSPARDLQRGAVSDLISILKVVANASPNGGWQARKGWSMVWPDGFGVEGLEDAAIAGMIAASKGLR